MRVVLFQHFWELVIFVYDLGRKRLSRSELTAATMAKHIRLQSQPSGQLRLTRRGMSRVRVLFGILAFVLFCAGFYFVEGVQRCDE